VRTQIVLPGIDGSPYLFPFEQITFDSWKDLRNYLFKDRENYGFNCVYRGHANAEWRLQPTLERMMPTAKCFRGEDWDAQQELHSIELFKRACHHYLSQEYLPKATTENQEYLSDREWLAIMQHSGSATRLLDVTNSPFVAAFFALSDIQLERAVACIWAFNWAMIETENPSKLGIKSIHVEEWKQRYKALPYRDCEAKEVIAIFEPERPTPRPFFQKGAFLYALDNDYSFEQTLAKYANTQGSVRKLCLLPLTNKMIKDALLDFREMTISYATLFPGLDGFAKDIALATFIGIAT
jgi:hypothetical protein